MAFFVIKRQPSNNQLIHAVFTYYTYRKFVATAMLSPPLCSWITSWRHPSPWNRQFFGVWPVELWVGDYCGFEGDCLLFFSRVPYYILINKRGLWTWKNSRNWGDGWRLWWNNGKYIYMSQLAQTPIRAGWNSLLSPFKAPCELAQIGMRRECHLMTGKCHPLFRE